MIKTYRSYSIKFSICHHDVLCLVPDAENYPDDYVVVRMSIVEVLTTMFALVN